MTSKSKGLVRFVKDIRNELKRISWPSQEEVKKAVGVVLAICAIYIALIAVADTIFKQLLTKFLLKL